MSGFRLYRRARRIALAGLASASLRPRAGGSDATPDPQSQIGPNPNLPEPRQYLFPPMHLASVTTMAAPSWASTAAGTATASTANKVVFVPFSDGKPNGKV